MHNDLISIIKSYDLEGKVHLLGYVDNIPRLLAESCFLVHTSLIEGLPNSVIEAMACERAVVATDAGDVPYIVEDGKTGFIVPTGNVEMLADRIAKLLDDFELCKRMGKAGREKVEREFTLDNLVKETLNAYRLIGWNDR